MRVVIVGNGISGISTARYLRKADPDAEIVVVSAESDHFFSRTALMYIFMGHMTFENTKPYEDWFWEENRISLVRDYVERVDFSSAQLALSSGRVLEYDKLVLALGSRSNKFGWPGQDLPGVQGLYSLQDLELLEENVAHGVEHAVIIGGGLIGVELAEMLHTRSVRVTFLVRERCFWGNVLPEEEGDFVCRHITGDHGVGVLLNANLEEIIPGDNGRVKAVRVKETGMVIDCQLVGLVPGVHPNVAFLKDTGLEIQRGIMINVYMETNIPNVYAVGDCAQHREPQGGRAPVEQVWYTGKMMGEALGKTLAGERTAYRPSHWYNSAKFFDIEYQTYGWVKNELQEGQQQFYWEHPDGTKCLKIVFDAATHRFIGLNIFGIRLRHELMERWQNEAQTVEYILEHLADANFDPEFYRHYEEQILEQFNRAFGTRLKPKKKSVKRIFLEAFGS